MIVDDEIRASLCEDFLYNNFTPYKLHVKYEIPIETVYVILKNNGEVEDRCGDITEETSF